MSQINKFLIYTTAVPRNIKSKQIFAINGVKVNSMSIALFFQNTVILIFVSVILIAKACNTKMEKNVRD